MRTLWKPLRDRPGAARRHDSHAALRSREFCPRMDHHERAGSRQPRRPCFRGSARRQPPHCAQRDTQTPLPALELRTRGVPPPTRVGPRRDQRSDVTVRRLIEPLTTSLRSHGHDSPVTSTPRVSVIMAVYNEESFLAEAAESVLAQSFTDFELIISDDGSTDR